MKLWNEIIENCVREEEYQGNFLLNLKANLANLSSSISAGY